MWAALVGLFVPTGVALAQAEVEHDHLVLNYCYTTSNQERCLHRVVAANEVLTPSGNSIVTWNENRETTVYDLDGQYLYSDEKTEHWVTVVKAGDPIVARDSYMSVQYWEYGDECHYELHGFACTLADEPYTDPWDCEYTNEVGYTAPGHCK